MKRGNQPPHHPVQVFKLPLTVSHLAHHGAQCCPLQHRDVIRETYVIYSSSCDAAVRPYQSGNSSRNRSSTGSCRPSADALHKLLQRQRHQACVLLRLHHIPARVQHRALNAWSRDASVVHAGYSLTHSTILSFGLNGPRESRPSLLITCRHTTKETSHRCCSKLPALLHHDG